MDEAARKQASKEYPRLHAATRRIISRLTKMVGPDRIELAARMLGFMGPGGVVTFDIEDDASVLFDFAIHELEDDGGFVRRIIAKGTDGYDPDELRVLRGMATPVFGMFVVEEILPGFGAGVRNGLTTEVHEVADLALSRTGMPGDAFIGHVIDVGDYWTTTGTAIAVGRAEAKAMGQALDELMTRSEWTNADERGAMIGAACRVRAARELGKPDEFGSEEMPDPALFRTRHERYQPALTRKASKNAPCPCGSGKKHKSCCGRS